MKNQKEETMNNFITEISEEDFKKLNLVGYDNERVDNNDGTFKFKFIQKHLNDKLEEYKRYLAETILKDKVDLPWVMTVCIHIEPTEEEVAWEEEILKTATANPNHPDHGVCMDYSKEAYLQALYNFSYLDKWMDRSGHTTYEFGIGLDHLYSTRDKWQARGWIDYFEVRKKDTKAVYIIHLDGKPGDFLDDTNQGN